MQGFINSHFIFKNQIQQTKPEIIIWKRNGLVSSARKCYVTGKLASSNLGDIDVIFNSLIQVIILANQNLFCGLSSSFFLKSIDYSKKGIALVKQVWSQIMDIMWFCMWPNRIFGNFFGKAYRFRWLVKMNFTHSLRLQTRSWPNRKKIDKSNYVKIILNYQIQQTKPEIIICIFVSFVRLLVYVCVWTLVSITLSLYFFFKLSLCYKRRISH